MKIFYSPNKHGRRVNNTNTIRTTPLQSRQKHLNGAIYFIAAFVLFYCTWNHTIRQLKSKLSKMQLHVTTWSASWKYNPQSPHSRDWWCLQYTEIHPCHPVDIDTATVAPCESSNISSTLNCHPLQRYISWQPTQTFVNSKKYVEIVYYSVF